MLGEYWVCASERECLPWRGQGAAIVGRDEGGGDVAAGGRRCCGVHHRQRAGAMLRGDNAQPCLQTRVQTRVQVPLVMIMWIGR